MERVCFILQVKPDRLAEYRERHRSVWPDMLAALTETGWHNYSLFLRDDGLLVGYLETPNYAAALAGMAIGYLILIELGKRIFYRVSTVATHPPRRYDKSRSVRRRAARASRPAGRTRGHLLAGGRG